MKYTLNLLFILVIIFITACHKDPPKTYDDYDMTVTNYNPDFDFSAYNSFVVPDSTVLKTNYMTESEVTYFYKSGGTSDKILDLIRQTFLGLGYNEVDSLSQSEFIALPTILMMQSEEQVWYSTGWWWGYPGYGWGWGYGWKSTSYYYWYPYYPGYAGYPVTITSETGTLIFEMIDTESYYKVLEWNEQNPDPPADPDDAPTLKINWHSYIEGTTTDDGQYNEDRVRRGVNEAISQSPYLQK